MRWTNSVLSTYIFPSLRMDGKSFVSVAIGLIVTYYTKIAYASGGRGKMALRNQNLPNSARRSGMNSDVLRQGGDDRTAAYRRAPSMRFAQMYLLE